MRDDLTAEVYWDGEAKSVLTRGATFGNMQDAVSKALRKAYSAGKARGEERGYVKGMQRALALAKSRALGSGTDAAKAISDDIDKATRP